jgi:RNA 2',3'-cyclic 3'-phosphodiesterase
LRLFVAVVPPPPLPSRLRDLQERLRETGADVKWVETDNLHLTIKFLGEASESLLPGIRETLSRVASSTAKFDLSLQGAGSFPPRGTPRVVWVGLRSDQVALARVSGAVETALEPLGVRREERPFSAHLTLGRVRSPREAEALRKQIESMQDVEIGQMQVVELCLMESQLGPQGPRYHHIEDFKFISSEHGSRP